MSHLNSPLDAAVTNALSQYSPFQRGGIDGSNSQITRNQQGNRTTTQGDQAPYSSGGKGAGEGGAAGPGGGYAGASGRGQGSSGDGAGVPMSGQQTGRYLPDEGHGARISFDLYTEEEEFTVTHHFAVGIVTSDMTGSALHFEWMEKTEICTRGCTVCRCKTQ